MLVMSGGLIWQHEAFTKFKTNGVIALMKKMLLKPVSSREVIKSSVKYPTEKRRSENATTTAKYLIYECTRNGLCGGWADRLSGIVSTYLLSLTTNRTFGIRITAPACNLTDYLEPNLVDWNIDTRTLKNLPTKRINLVDHRLFFSSADKVNFSELMNETVVYYRENYEFITRLQKSVFHASDFLWMKKWTRDRVFAHVMNILFKLSKRLDTALVDFINKAKPNEKWKLMCAHIRMGRNPSIPRDSEKRNTPDTIRVIWDFMAKHYTCDRCKIFVATDSEDVRQEARRLFPDRIVDIPGDIVHIEKDRSTRTCDAFAKLILDQHVLSKCDSLLLTKSGIGKIGAYLRGTDENLYCLSRKRIIKCIPHNVTSVFGMFA